MRADCKGGLLLFGLCGRVVRAGGFRGRVVKVGREGGLREWEGGMIGLASLASNILWDYAQRAEVT